MTFANDSLNPVFADRAYTYKVITPPAITPISVDEVKSFAKISTSADNDLISVLISSAVEYAEQLTKRDFITRTYRTFRDHFPEPYLGFCDMHPHRAFKIRKSPLQEILQITYIDQSNNTVVVDPSIYYYTEEDDYSSLINNPGKSWPGDSLERLQAIQIDFNSGYGDTGDSVPATLRNALLMHVTFLYENRGDCEEICSGSAKCGPSSTPSSSKSIYLQYRIENL